MHRTTSPQAVYRSTRDTRNAPLWNPSSERLLNVEEDEAGRLRAFRSRFGRNWDAANTVSAEDLFSGASKNKAESVEASATETDAELKKQQEATAAVEAAIEKEMEEEDDNLLDLISSFGQDMPQQPQPKAGKKK